MTRCTIRKAVVEDADQIASLLEELGYPSTPAFAREKIATLSKSPDDAYLVADVDGRVVAAAHLHVAELFHRTGCLGRVMALVVSSKHKRSGIGRKLLTALEIVARDAGCTKLEVTSGAGRSDAHAFYEALGYAERPKRFVKTL